MQTLTRWHRRTGAFEQRVSMPLFTQIGSLQGPHVLGPVARSLIGTGSFEVVLSVPLLLEYEAVVLRDLAPGSSERPTREDILDYLCAVGERHEIFFLWRPHLRDPKDEMVLEAAVAGGCGRIISFNKKNFAGAERFGVAVRTPREFLEEIGAVS